MKKIFSPNDISRQRALALSRRRFLKGFGVAIAMPAFESLLPGSLYASDVCSTSCAKAPQRMAFVYFPNGAHQKNWWPEGEEKDFQLNQTMLPLENVKNSIQVISGLEHRNATAGPDGPGDHARANATFLTGVRARKTDGSNIHLGISIDQLAARHIGHLSRFPSLELSCDAVRKSGGCDSGYSCAYQYNLSWASDTTPMTPEPNPRLLFERLFGAGSNGERQKNYHVRQQTQKSILDFVLDDAHALQRDLGKQDQQKLDEYLTGVREIEERIEHAESFGEIPDPEIETPAGIPPDYGQHMELMYDMLALAFQTDTTRIATLLLAGDGTNRSFPQIDVPEGHHYLSHHGRDEEKLEKIAKIDLYYMQHFARFLEKLEKIQDVDGTSILHNSMIVYGCGNCDGDRHNHDNLPVVLAGAGGGTLQTGRYLKLPDTPMTNLYLSMLDRLEIEGVDQFGDSTGRIDTI
jgi:hypothetical protein